MDSLAKNAAAFSLPSSAFGLPSRLVEACERRLSKRQMKDEVGGRSLRVEWIVGARSMAHMWLVWPPEFLSVINS